jgi:hypothetical protein
MLYQTVLDKINKIRIEFNLESLKDLPKGKRESSNSCPIATALKELDEDIEVNPDNIQFYTLSLKDKQKIAQLMGDDYWSEDRDFVALTSDISGFIQEFDEGWIPEYDINSGEF